MICSIIQYASFVHVISLLILANQCSGTIPTTTDDDAYPRHIRKSNKKETSKSKEMLSESQYLQPLHRQLLQDRHDGKSFDSNSDFNVFDSDENEAHRKSFEMDFSSVLDSDWWVRLGEKSNAPKPRRAHAATVYLTQSPSSLEASQNQALDQEYMIISGGFSDGDWKTFPVWGYDMTSATLYDHGSWMEITPNYYLSDSCRGSVMEMTPYKGWDDATACPPPPRIGHISIVREDYLYVFGGLLYNDADGVFYQESEPFMYRLGLRNGHSLVQPDGTWERILPRVGQLPPSILTEDTSKDELNRGEVRGGYWKNGDQLIIYGGLQVIDYKSSFGKIQQDDVTLGDIWAFDFASNEWLLVSQWVHDVNCPDKRTSHAATVVGDELIIHGGLRKVNAYMWDGTTIWKQLDDVWVFDLNTRKWKERPMAESMGRSYHSLVGWEDSDEGGSILASFGGYKTIVDPVDNEPISYSYDDTLVSYPPPTGTDFASIWYTATYEQSRSHYMATIPKRLEHTAVLSSIYGNMFIWGGRLRNTASTIGVWSLNVAGPNSQVSYKIREDENVNDVGYAYGVLISVMITSMFFTYSCGVLSQRLNRNHNSRTSLEHVPNDDTTYVRRNGLGQDIIDTLPLKIYSVNNVNQSDSVMDEEEAISSDTQGLPRNGNDDQSEWDEDDDCCPICLVEYEEGDELRCLPCKHMFHKSCADSWLENNASCPTCRYSLDELALLTASPVSNTTTYHHAPSPSSDQDRERTTSIESLSRFDFLNRLFDIGSSNQDERTFTAVSRPQMGDVAGSDNVRGSEQSHSSTSEEVTSRRRRRLLRIRARMRNRRLRAINERADSGTDDTLELSYSSSLEISSSREEENDEDCSYTPEMCPGLTPRFQRRRVRRQKRRKRRSSSSPTTLSDPLEPNSSNDIALV